MKILTLVLLFGFIACKSDGTRPKSFAPAITPDPYASFSKLKFEEKATLSVTQLQAELILNHRDFHKPPRKGDTRNLGSSFDSTYALTEKENGTVTRNDTCVITRTAEVNATVTDKESGIFTEKGSLKIVSSNLDSGPREQCERLVPEQGKEFTFTHRFPYAPYGFTNFALMMVRRLILMTESLPERRSRRINNNISELQISRGLFKETNDDEDEGITAYRIRYSFIDDASDGRLSYRCQTILDPNRSAHYSIRINECLADNFLKVIKSNGNVIEFAEKSRMFNKEQ